MERSSTAWRPYMWPIKVVMIVGFFLMLLQCCRNFSKMCCVSKGKTSDVI